MTCIVGLSINGAVLMGADNQTTSGYLKIGHATTSPKVFRRSNLLFGISGSVRAQNVLQTRFTPPERAADEPDDLSYLVTIVESLRVLFRDAGIAKIENAVENNGEDGSSLLIGYHGRLFQISSDWSILEPSLPYIAIGSGREYALGSMHALSKTSAPQKTVRAALMAAAEFDIYCSGPFVIEELNAEVA
jgi:ATP-dependent protease HslVU (ClpYQ) peptidase subunit